MAARTGATAGLMLALVAWHGHRESVPPPLGQAGTFKIEQQRLELFDGAVKLVASLEAQTQLP